MDTGLQGKWCYPKTLEALPGGVRANNPRPLEPTTSSHLKEGNHTMGMFTDLMNKIFRHSANAERPHDAYVPGTPITVGTAMPSRTTTTVMAPVDVDVILTKLASENKETLDWKHSIVDLMKLVDMDSSIAARKTLAAELHYTGNTDDSASMNTWLHKEVMRKLADNGGKLPADLLDN